MFTTNRKLKQRDFDIWPGFVDALATLLIVIIFVLMTFVVSQFYLADALIGRDEALQKLNAELHELNDTLETEQNIRHQAEDKIVELDSLMAQLKQELSIAKRDLIQVQTDLKQEEQEKQASMAKIMKLTQQIKELNVQITTLNRALELESDKNEEQIEKMQELEEALSSQLSDKVAELQRLNERLNNILAENATLDDSVKKLNIKLKDALGGVGQFRSEFFAKLRTSLGNRNDIRIVGDRFVFQSEVLFAQGSSTIQEGGKEQLEQLATTLLEISSHIPKDVNWILRVDGHTDKAKVRPNARYKSNWDLSSQRAIAVVKFLISKGIPDHRLVAAGFGEHQPIESVKEPEDPIEMARNRRIEFKLDQR